MECLSLSIEDEHIEDEFRLPEEAEEAEEAFYFPIPPDVLPISVAWVSEEQTVDEEVSTADSLLDILLPPPSLDKPTLPPPSLDKSTLPFPLPGR